MASASTRGNQDKDPHLPPPSKQSLLFCPKSKLHIHRAEISKIMRECQEESFWKRALPFSLVSMLVTQGLVYQETVSRYIAQAGLELLSSSDPPTSASQSARITEFLMKRMHSASCSLFPALPCHGITLTRCQLSALGLPSLQNCEPSELLFFISYPACGILL
ncbi:OCIA domain-containing protein 2 isoform X3 [Callithrix jacchus]|uniref:OCIA domain-containing protein 2 isoform X3 n=1 Tax=Callithrix jacchus TaxID=9483 RepID=UPI0023DD27AF|nr:OCIA domain-containing protein 2 isoform X3 [Callithrix jacchus]